jgi:hypothetical protein
MRVDSKSSSRSIPRRPDKEEQGPGAIASRPLPPVLLAVVLAYRVGYAVRVGVGPDRRAVGKVTVFMQCRNSANSSRIQS